MDYVFNEFDFISATWQPCTFAILLFCLPGYLHKRGYGQTEKNIASDFAITLPLLDLFWKVQMNPSRHRFQFQLGTSPRGLRPSVPVYCWWKKRDVDDSAKTLPIDTETVSFVFNILYCLSLLWCVTDWPRLYVVDHEPTVRCWMTHFQMCK